MPKKKIEDFSPTELDVVKTTLTERFGQEIPVELGDAEIRLYPDDRELVTRPVMYWASPEDDSKFFIAKVKNNEFRCQFFYRGYQQYGTGKDRYDNVGDCVISMLQVHTEHEEAKKQEQS